MYEGSDAHGGTGTEEKKYKIITEGIKMECYLKMCYDLHALPVLCKHLLM